MVRPVCGSPPRGRGKVAGAACRDLLGGITPAWAGKRRCTAACNRLCWDHPRVGGEKIDSLPHRALYLGSPPRGRGKDLVRFYPLCFPGITPAWAGKRYDQLGRRAEGQDHPRVGGEKQGAQVLGGFGLGSPPRGRGKEGGCVQRKSPARITPAWAGKRAPSRLLHITQRDHPRVGGEKRVDACNGNHPQGSPPRGRGKAKRSLRLLLPAGITPAWAGKSHPSGSSMACW